MTKGKFGFHRGAGKYELGPAATYVQIYVKASALSREYPGLQRQSRLP